MKNLISDTPLLSRVLPFALFMAFIAVDEGAGFLAARRLIHLPATALYYLYPVKVLAVALTLYLYRHHYHELRLEELACRKRTALVCVVGLVTFILWVWMDWTFSVTGAPGGFDPTRLPEGPVRLVMTFFRVAGAAVVVPVMEELFWRSFLLRYLIDTRFESVALGRFTWSSFLATTLLFGLEHHLIVAGMVAGALYNGVLYKTRSITQCVLAHAVTNLTLAGYVLYTSRWHFW